MPSRKLPRFDFWPLERLVAQRVTPEAAFTNSRDTSGSVLWRRPTAGDIARYLDVHPKAIYRYRNEGLTDRAADQLACHGLNLHPCLIWPDWWDKTEPVSMMPSVEECSWS